MLAFTALACEQPKIQKQEEAPTKKPGAMVTQPGAQVGDTTLCPVMKEKFTITEETPTFTHKGETIYVCCKGCVETLEDDPEELDAMLQAVNEKIKAENQVP